jgi:Tol biopolymer transport system component
VDANGRRLIFASERARPRNLFSQAADGSGIVEQLTDGPNAQNPTAITPDGMLANAEMRPRPNV